MRLKLIAATIVLLAVCSGCKDEYRPIRPIDYATARRATVKQWREGKITTNEATDRINLLWAEVTDYASDHCATAKEHKMIDAANREGID